jgi:hypothetical protein
MGFNFQCNEIIPIGGSLWQLPFTTGVFSYHEVGWAGGATSNDNIFDACLEVDNDGDPTAPPRSGCLPTDIVFDDNSPAPPYADYHEKLAAPGSSGVGNCVARPGTRQRRGVE